MDDLRLFAIQEDDDDILNPATIEVLDRYLTFVSDSIIFAVSTDYVIEIIANYAIRPVPMLPDYVMGVINLRGQVLPVIDVRMRMNKPFVEYNSNTCIIILEVDSTLVGLAVDSVSQVVELRSKDAVVIPVENHHELTDSMISLGDDTVALLLDCNAVIATV